MRGLVKARVKPGREKALLQAIADGTLGQGSIAGDEYLHDMEQARVAAASVAHWAEKRLQHWWHRVSEWPR